MRAGLREALHVATDNAVRSTGRLDGYFERRIHADVSRDHVMVAMPPGRIVPLEQLRIASCWFVPDG